MGLSATKAGFVAAVAAATVATATVTVTTATWAEAKANYESPYGYVRTWNAALRFVRVDNGWKITEKDEASGYLLFEYRSPESSKATAGALELVRGQDDDGPVGVLAELAQMPRYHEQMMLDSLAAKMRREYGAPPHRPKGERAPPDAGAGDGP